MSKSFFGTDGIRAPISHENLAPEKICKLGCILGSLALKNGFSSVVIGRDTRASGVYLEAALESGILSLGVDCHILGVAPSAAVAYATTHLKAGFGVVISASHNPACDNGIKIFGNLGHKIEENIERIITDLMFDDHVKLPVEKHSGVMYQNCAILDDYCSMIAKSVPGGLLKNRRIVIDCAHGAATAVIDKIVSSLAADVTIIGNQPDGYNINHDVGSEHPALLIHHVRKEGADLGIAFDGDADRVIFVDEKGEVIDGDALLALLAIFLKKEGKLHKNTLVSTFMSSIALDQALLPHEIKVERSPVGDKYVVRHLMSEQLNLGGENSGHLILFPHTSTGDGLFFALQFMSIMNTQDTPVSSLFDFYRPTPKILKNLSIKQKVPLENLLKTHAMIKHYEQALLGNGRIMVRYSGTENKLRILVESLCMKECEHIATTLGEVFLSELEDYLAAKSSK